MNKKKLLSIISLLVVAIFIWQLALYNQKPSDGSSAVNETSEDLAIHEAYPALPEDNKFIEESAPDIIKRLESGTGVVMLGFKECPWCQKAAPLLNEAAESEDENVYYLDIKQERDNNLERYRELIAILSEHLPKDEDGLPQVTTPDISFVKDGEIVWRYELEPTTEAELTPETYWTEERQARAIQSFKDNMKAIERS